SFERTRSSIDRDDITGLPTFQHIERFIASEISQASVEKGVAIVLIKPRDGQPLRQNTKAKTGSPLHHLPNATPKGLPVADVLFRSSADEFVVLLAQTDALSAQGIVSRIANSIRESHDAVGDDRISSVTLGVATAPADGSNMDALMVVARQKQRPLHTDSQ